MGKPRPVLFTYRVTEKPFQGIYAHYVSGYSRDGKRIQQWFRTAREAKTVRDAYNAEIEANGTAVSLSPTARLEAIAATEKLARFGKTLAEAADFYVAYLVKQASSITVAELADRVAAEFERRLRENEISRRHFGSMRETLKKFRTRFAETPIKLLVGTEIKAWLAGLPLAVKTRNRHLSYIRNILGIAREANLLETDPLERVSSFNDPRKRNGFKVAILTPDELEKFLNAAADDLRAFFALSAFSGLRREEIVRLDWAEVKLDRNLIDLPFEKSKNKKRKLIEVPANLAAILAPYAAASGPVTPRKKLDRAISAAAKAADIVPWRQNCLRHSFCSYAVADKGFEWTAAQADHSVRMLRDHYWEVVSKEDAEKYWAIKP